MIHHWKRVLAAALLVGAATLGAAACDDDEDNGDGAGGGTQQAVEELASRVQRNEMITAVLEIEAMPLHEIHMAIGDGKVPADAIPTMRLLARLAQITYWSADLAPAAAMLRDDALALITLLEDGEMDAGNEQAGVVHEGGHQFVTDAWEILAPGTGPGGEHGAGEMEDGMDVTPEAEERDDGMDMTPEAETTP